MSFNHLSAHPERKASTDPVMSKLEDSGHVHCFKGFKEGIISNRRIYFMAASASFGGMFFGWDAGAIAGVVTMDSFKHSFALHKIQESAELATLNGNILSTLQAGCFFGALSSGYFSERFGRKPALMISATISLIGSIIQICSGIASTSLSSLYIGRTIGGLGVGMASALIPTYISESSPQSIRGRMTGIFQLFIVAGLMLSYFVNYGASKYVKPHLNPVMWRIGLGCQIIPGGLFVLGMLFQHESPRWLCQSARYDEAATVIGRYRDLSPTDPIVIKQLADIRKDLEGQPRSTIRQQLLLMFSSRIIFYRSILGSVLMFCQQWTGINAVNYYAPRIFFDLGITGTEENLLVIGVYGIIRVIFVLVTLMFIVEQRGRKICLICGGLGQALAFFYIGIFQIVHGTSDVVPASYVAIVMIYLYAIFDCLGWGAVPCIVAGEVPPTSTRPLSLSLATATQWLFNFVITKITPTLFVKLRYYGTFLLFAFCLLAMVTFVYFGVPETAGVPLERIHELFETPEGIIARSVRDSPGGPKLLRCVGCLKAAGVHRN